MFDPNRDEVTHELSILHKEEPRGLYSSPTVVRAVDF
jgi:hypothetical protein